MIIMIFTWVYFLKSKGETLKKFQIFKTMIENVIDHWIKCLKIDQGQEFTSRQLCNFCDKNEMQQKT